MNRSRGLKWVLLAAVTATVPGLAAERVGSIEFFGYKGLDVEKIREALPLRAGDEYTAETKDRIRRAAGRVTDIAAVCCDENGAQLIFVGLAGESYKDFAYNRQPTGRARLGPEILGIYGRLETALEAAVRKGGEAAQEDDSQGYALAKDPPARTVQLELRAWALQHERELFRVLETSADARHRRVASDAAGYLRQSKRQMEALVRASRDPDDEVRNNATRALVVLLRGNASLAEQVEPGAFVEMLSAGTWTDRNKGAALLVELTKGREADLLAKLRAEALDSLVEMALWRQPSHAYFARILLGRVAGVPEEKLGSQAWNGPVKEIVEAARRR